MHDGACADGIFRTASCKLLQSGSRRFLDRLTAEVSLLPVQLAGDEDVVAATTTVSIRCAAAMIPIQTPANYRVGEGV